MNRKANHLQHRCHRRQSRLPASRRRLFTSLYHIHHKQYRNRHRTQVTMEDPGKYTHGLLRMTKINRDKDGSRILRETSLAWRASTSSSLLNVYLTSRPPSRFSSVLTSLLRTSSDVVGKTEARGGTINHTLLLIQ